MIFFFKTQNTAKESYGLGMVRAAVESVSSKPAVLRVGSFWWD